MAYKINQKIGRPRGVFKKEKIRNLEAITPKGYVLYKIYPKKKQAVFKLKEVKDV